MSIDLKLPDQSTALWKNVFGLQVEGTADQTDGSRIPAVWIKAGPADVMLHITNMIATESNPVTHNYQYDLQAKSNTGNWFNLKLSQKDGLYEIKIDDELVHSVLNTEPKTYTNVKLVTGNDYGWAISANGDYRNFELSGSYFTKLQTSTMDLESLQKSKHIELINPADVLQRSLATKQQTIGIKMRRKLMCRTPETECMHDLQYFYDGSLLSSDDFVVKSSYHNLSLTFFGLLEEYKVSTKIINTATQIDNRNKWYKTSDYRDTEALLLESLFSFFVTFDRNDLVNAHGVDDTVESDVRVSRSINTNTITFFEFGIEDIIVSLKSMTEFDGTYQLIVSFQSAELIVELSNSSTINLEISNIEVDNNQFHTLVSQNGELLHDVKNGKRLRPTTDRIRVYNQVDFQLEMLDRKTDDLGALAKVECESSDSCGKNGICKIVDNMEVCICLNGFELSGSECVDIDECGTFNDCQEQSICTNTEGSFTCTCLDGYSSPNPRTTSCANINECETLSPCPVTSDCHDTDGHYECHCHTGYEHLLKDDGTQVTQ